ncbi:hypothetical protein NUW54_g12738 [Trametes sanguinea]|uniref:Uncharacterized protein n=1 Tax=Trametes sanguinea TaxID=158606 RepID=A0ACC1MTS8_9APHY|nr:hypothetical protein NUW54_g12738 [Trametes sanguinea]
MTGHVDDYAESDCAPNVRKERDGRTLRFLTTRPVEAGEELCISYGHVETMDVKTRRQELLEGWYFECRRVERAHEHVADSMQSLGAGEGQPLPWPSTDEKWSEVGDARVRSGASGRARGQATRLHVDIRRGNALIASTGETEGGVCVRIPRTEQYVEFTAAVKERTKERLRIESGDRGPPHATQCNMTRFSPIEAAITRIARHGDHLVALRVGWGNGDEELVEDDRKVFWGRCGGEQSDEGPRTGIGREDRNTGACWRIRLKRPTTTGGRRPPRLFLLHHPPPLALLLPFISAPDARDRSQPWATSASSFPLS